MSLGCSCHSSIHSPLPCICHLSPWMLTHFCSIPQQCSASCCKKSSLSSFLHSSLHAVSLPLSLLSAAPLSLRLNSSLFFAPAPSHICIWMSRSLPGPRCSVGNVHLCSHVWRVRCTGRNYKIRLAGSPWVLEAVPVCQCEKVFLSIFH